MAETVPSVTYASDIKLDQLPQSVCTEDAQLDEESSTNSDEQKEQQQLTEESRQTEAQSVNTQSSDSPTLQALGTTVYANGNDANAGTSDQPVKTLTKAIELAGENGTVIMQDTVRIAGNVVLDNNDDNGKCIYP